MRGDYKPGCRCISQNCFQRTLSNDLRGSMRRLWNALVVGIVLLAGCGARISPAIGFVNQTQHSDAQLWSLWKAAQQNLSQQIDMNPLQRTLNSAPAHIVPG